MKSLVKFLQRKTMPNLYRLGDATDELVLDILLGRCYDHNHRPTGERLGTDHRYSEAVPAEPKKEPLFSRLLASGNRAPTKLQLPATTARNVQPKPVLRLYPNDRPFIAVYITKTYGALVSAGYEKSWARTKAREWDTMRHPKMVIEDMLCYVDIELVPVVPFEYFRD